MNTVFYRIANWYFSLKALPYWIILFADTLIGFLASFFVIWMYWRPPLTWDNVSVISHTLLLYIIFNLISFRIFHTYSGIIRYSSFIDLRRVGFAMALACVLALIAHYPINMYVGWKIVPLLASHIVAIYVITTLGMWAMRIIIKSIYEVSLASPSMQNVLIYGAGSGAIGLAKSLNAEKPARYLLKGFIDNDTEETNLRIMGERVYSRKADILKVIRDKNINAILVSPLQNSNFRKDNELIDILSDNDVQILIASDIKQWTANDSFSVAQLNPIKVEDLLPRSPININMQAIRYALQGQSIMITGSSGSIGHEIVRQVAGCQPRQLILVDIAETPQNDLRLEMAADFPDINTRVVVGSIAHEKRMEKLFERYRPDIIFHAAAYKHVPMMEDNPAESILNNIHGTKIIADLSTKYNVKKFVMLSTDKAVNPTNVMGCSKRICEIYVQSLDKQVKAGSITTIDSTCATTQFITTRFGNVLASNGSVIPLFEKQIANGGPVTVTHPEIRRYFMLIPEACRLVLEAGAHGTGGEIFVFDMGTSVKIVDLARRMIQLSGKKDINIEIVGLRDGEKIYEEVFSDEETTKPSFHEKIRIATVREYEYKEVNTQTENIIKLAYEADNMTIVAAMKDIVPEYISQNSVYTQLDKPAASPQEK